MRGANPRVLLNLMPEGCSLPGSQVTTVHDLLPLLYPRSTRGSDTTSVTMCRRCFEPPAPSSLISESTRRDLLRFYDVAPEKVHVVLSGYDAERFNPGARYGPRAPGGAPTYSASAT